MKNQRKSDLHDEEIKAMTLRLPKSLHERLDRLSKEQRRSLHGQAVWAVEQHVEQQEEAAA